MKKFSFPKALSSLALIWITTMASPALAVELVNTPKTSFSLYGQLWLKLNEIDEPAANRDGLSLDLAETRIGVKGDHVIGEDLKGFFVLELGYNDGDSGLEALTQREALAGLKGPLGQIYAGRASSAYKMAGVKIDPFNDTASGTGLGGPNFGMSGFTSDFFDDAVAVVSPDLFIKGLTFNGMVFIDDSNADDHDFNVGVNYETENLDLYVQYLVVENGTDHVVLAGDEKALRVSGQWKSSRFALGASFENFSEADVDLLYLTASAFLPSGKASVSYGDVEGTGTGYSAGYFHNLSDSLTAYLLHSDVDGEVVADDRSASSLGLTYAF